MIPVVSVIIPTYNRENFILNSVNSVLSQTFQEIEVIIIDDGSTDNSPDLISSISDSRVRSIILGKNIGECEATNIGIRESKAPLIAICHSDDEWINTKLASQLEIISASSSLGAVFSYVIGMDEQGKQMAPHPYGSLQMFRQHNRSRAVWLRDLVEYGNCLCHPSVLIRREVYEECGYYDKRYRQVPDFDMWLRILERFDIFVLDQELVRYRIHRQSISSNTPDNSIRTMNEWAIILKKFFQRLSAETFAASFGTLKSLDHPEFSLPLEKSLYLSTRTRANQVMMRNIGMEILHESLETQANFSSVLKSYGLPPDTFHIMMGLSSPFTSNRQLLGPLTDKERSFLALVIANAEGIHEEQPEPSNRQLSAVELAKQLPGMENMSDEEVARALAAFDMQYYLARYPDVAARKMDPLEHYMRFGWKEGRDPSPGFSTRNYLDHLSDVLIADTNPFLHWIFQNTQEQLSNE